MVAGVIGATHDNARGVDGVDPFARMLAQAVGNSVAGTATAYQAAWSVGEAMVYGLTGFIRKHQDVPVINMSLSYNWGRTASTPRPTPRRSGSPPRRGRRWSRRWARSRRCR
jgi:subtilisin family serine protease